IAAQGDWRRRPVTGRAALLGAFIDTFIARRDEIALELTWQMGRPIRYSPGEIRGFEERARTMVALASRALADIDVGQKDGFRRFIRHDPLGVVLVIAPWNYPYLTAVNSVVPALMAGNSVLLKHAQQTPLCAERLAAAANAAGLPNGLLQAIHTSHDATTQLIRNDGVAHVAFTGSVSGGRAMEAAAVGRFIRVGLEVGGKGPAYVRHAHDVDHAIETLVDGAFFNSGQSCCGIERIYVHEKLFDGFVQGATELTQRYVLGKPTNPDTTLGPLVRTSAAEEAITLMNDSEFG